MKKILLLLIAASLTACAFPRSPADADLLNGSRQHQTKLFEAGSRGQIIASMTDNVSSTGWFGKEYKQVMAFKNVQSGEPFFFKTEGKGTYDTAMLPIGDYVVTGLRLEYVFTRCEQIGQSRQCTTHVETIEDFEGNSKITFRVKPGVVTYIGNIELIQPDNKVAADGRTNNLRSFKIADKSGEIAVRQKDRWKKEFGKDFVVSLATVK